MPVGATLTAAGATVGSSLIGASAAGSASRAASAANAANQAYLHGVYNDTQTNLNPTITAGQHAGSALSGLLGIGGDPAASAQAFNTFRNSTNYNFLMDQGTQAVKTANAPSFNSGATAKALLNYGQGMAGNALSGYEGMLQGQQQLGAQSALGVGQIGAGIGSTISGSNLANAGAQGSSALGQAGALSGGLNGLSSLFNKQQTASSFGGGDAGTFAGVTPGDFGATPSFNVNALGGL